MKLGKRLAQIEQMVTAGYTHIWDCCCDHGLLGTALLNKHTDSNVHFVDIVPELITSVTDKLQHFYPSEQKRWHTHCIDVATLPLKQFSGSHLIIIAGIGGDLMIDFVSAIVEQHRGEQIDFLLCPVHHQFKLRQSLQQHQLSVIDECLMKENQRFYEIMLVSTTASKGNVINLVGDKMWQAVSQEQAHIGREYLDKTLRHYQRIQQGKKKDVAQIVKSYQAVTL
ncbi:hypothetical protein JCM19238_648 [Vibrio ponticus]|nr:hypothetical protein JCM19238_648 [Vibrio ponticus]